MYRLIASFALILCGYLLKGNEQVLVEKIKTSTAYILHVIKETEVNQSDLEEMKLVKNQAIKRTVSQEE